MVVFPNCKINLGLHITEKRKDGYHNLETVFYPVQLKDALEIVQQHHPDSHPEQPVIFNTTGLPIPGDESNNLCIKAYTLLKKDFPELPPVHMHLHKVIPMGAGLGGGSADGAFALGLLNEKFNLQISKEKLVEYAAQLGSDCPFFILNQPCYASGRGEMLEPIDVDLSAYHIVLIHPGIHVSTKWAFEQLTPQQPIISIREIIQRPAETWKNNLRNDFEAPIAASHPLIKELIEALYQQGAIYAAMSGSGSSIFGIFKENPPEKWMKTTKYPFDIILKKQGFN